MRDDPADWFSLDTVVELPFGPGQAVLMRTDPPVDENYLHDTQLLDFARRQGALVVNDPRGLRDFNEKLAALEFPECCPPTLVSRDAATLKAFVNEQGQAVLKPLDGMGGRSIFRAAAGEPNLNVILETLTDGGRNLAMAQRYLPEIVDGDKRVLLIDGEPVDYALARIPQGDEFRGNLAAGGRGEGRPLSERDRWIAARVGPEMKRRGMLFVGPVSYTHLDVYKRQVETSPSIRLVALEARSASRCTSSATTAKPRPASPADAAWIDAFSARMLVCSEMSLMSSTIAPISCEDSPRRLIRLEVSWIWSRMLSMP